MLSGNINPISSALNSIKLLSPVSYQYKDKETTRINLPEGEQFGFIAQEMEKVFPQLIKQEIAPASDATSTFDKDDLDNKNKEDTANLEPSLYKGINYIGLIPILTAAIKEQQIMIEEQQKMIEEMKKEMGELKGIQK